MNRSNNHCRTAPPIPLIILVMLIGVLMAVLINMATQDRIGAAQSTRHFVDVPPATSQLDAAVRTVVVAGPSERLPHMSNANGMLMTNLVSGELPKSASKAIVRSDSNCQPDAQGVSHCLNELEIGTTKLLVRHNHMMSEVPCLTPGETVFVMGT